MIVFGTAVIPGADGRTAIVAAQFGSGDMQIMLRIDAEQADQFADEIAAGIKAAAAEARQLNGGLILPGVAGQLLVPTPQPTPPPTGNGNGASPIVS